MKIILAPSKTMTMSRELPRGCESTAPLFLSKAEELVAALRTTSDMKSHMLMSQAIADSTTKLYEKWGKETSSALLAYVGDVYKGFYAETLSRDDLEWAQQHVYIMSGLYGILRPTDTISPYRLEMKARVSVGDSRNLYDFWGDKLARVVDEESNGVVCILSSDEYAKPITKYTKSRIITPVFLDNKTNGQLGTVPIYSKMMRGVLARWMIDNRVQSLEELTSFAAQGYRYDLSKSNVDQPAFYRKDPAPIRY